MSEVIIKSLGAQPALFPYVYENFNAQCLNTSNLQIRFNCTKGKQRAVFIYSLPENITKEIQELFIKRMIQ